ncbi:hypothetical protein EK21DRAFT_97157 [Setomelanomma holmii]|uniref:Heterokaryon incompatibility domain-containing protein n=1 Tax=Setomelanomma holmii TaxID=210430 RepID=A0A9P4HL26_9PLEO|nr:hypothetical protein EK21DRAFT_97157 [Setomelanomma holmii]
MSLLNTQSQKLSHTYELSEAPDSAILSHRWTTIQGACNQARKDCYDWIWIDSCCIDKASSADLSEAINSMWKFYAEANEAGWSTTFAESKWFTRGWTLQELVAPSFVEFYAENWDAIGTKFERYQQIADIASIDQDVLVGVQDVDLFNQAYSLLGLFDVNMPLLYGEGQEKAFVRFQEAIYNTTADHSMFLFQHAQHKDGLRAVWHTSTRTDHDDCHAGPQ